MDLKALKHLASKLAGGFSLTPSTGFPLFSTLVPIALAHDIPILVPRALLTRDEGLWPNP
jgi:hypothetical protein